ENVRPSRCLALIVDEPRWPSVLVLVADRLNRSLAIRHRFRGVRDERVERRPTRWRRERRAEPWLEVQRIRVDPAFHLTPNRPRWQSPPRIDPGQIRIHLRDVHRWRTILQEMREKRRKNEPLKLPRRVLVPIDRAQRAAILDTLTVMPRPEHEIEV